MWSVEIQMSLPYCHVDTQYTKAACTAPVIACFISIPNHQNSCFVIEHSTATSDQYPSALCTTFHHPIRSYRSHRTYLRYFMQLSFSDSNLLLKL